MRRTVFYNFLAFAAGAIFCGLAAALHSEVLTGFDEAVRTSLHSFASPSVTALAERLTWLGSLGVLATFTSIVVIVLTMTRSRIEAAFFATLMVGAFALENGLKFWFRRVRPPAFFGAEPTTYSFPSGHALFSLCFYTGLAIAWSRWSHSSLSRAGSWIAAATLVLAIGATRIYLGVHYPSDVLGGYLVATAWTAVLLAAFRQGA